MRYFKFINQSYLVFLPDYAYRFNSCGGGNKQGGSAKAPELINNEKGINEKVGFWGNC